MIWETLSREIFCDSVIRENLYPLKFLPWNVYMQKYLIMIRLFTGILNNSYRKMCTNWTKALWINWPSRKFILQNNAEAAIREKLYPRKLFLGLCFRENLYPCKFVVAKNIVIVNLPWLLMEDRVLEDRSHQELGLDNIRKCEEVNEAVCRKICFR